MSKWAPTPVCEDDVRWASEVLGLPTHAFSGSDGSDPRLKVLLTNESIDVAACPGSGKTTLLVAKLAILAKSWPKSTQGICVLSHTNVARLEIERRLANDPTGKKILSYPHFVGTIHGFINTFIALPFLRSQGIPVVSIDDDQCCRHRWFKLNRGQRNAMEQNHHAAHHMRIKDAHFDLGEISWGRGRLGRNTPIYQALVEACRATTNEGYHCHDDMLIWAEQAIVEASGLTASVRERFPYIFLDEVQDNSEQQSRLLHRIFSDGQLPAKRQRFGDMNQAIYGNTKETSSAQIDPFPQSDILIDIPNSHRFGQQIASVADPVALVPPRLIGLRAPHDGVETAVLLFAANEAAWVLPAYAQLLIERFNEEERRTGVFAAVGSVRRPGAAGDPPDCVAHYWASYEANTLSAQSAPATFLAHVRAGIAAAAAQQEIKPIVDRVAEGLIRLAALLDPAFRPAMRKSWHRYARDLLIHDPAISKRYCDLALALATGRLPNTREHWERWKAPVVEIATAMLQGSPTATADDFLDWDDAITIDIAKTSNLFSYPPEDSQVRVKVGTIHSIKGETHMAILVLDTHYYGSHLIRIKDWLTGRQRGLAAHPVRERVRASLKQHYVAMTRPSHLLCLAMRSGDLSAEDLQLMHARGWSIGDVSLGEVRWHQ